VRKLVEQHLRASIEQEVLSLGVMSCDCRMEVSKMVGNRFLVSDEECALQMSFESSVDLDLEIKFGVSHAESILLGALETTKGNITSVSYPAKQSSLDVPGLPPSLVRDLMELQQSHYPVAIVARQKANENSPSPISFLVLYSVDTARQTEAPDSRDVPLVASQVFVTMPRDEFFTLHDVFFGEVECSVCCVDRCNVILLPCRHSCLCELCYSHVNKCPICRSVITNVLILKE